MVPSGEPIDVACLCAAWCRLCDSYRDVLASVAGALTAELAGAPVALRWHWVDIEDEADLVGDLDVETFPTLVIADRTQVRFAGPLMPQPETLQRLLRATVLDAAPGQTWPAVEPAVQALATRLRGRAPDGVPGVLAVPPRPAQSP